LVSSDDDAIVVGRFASGVLILLNGDTHEAARPDREAEPLGIPERFE